MCAHYTYNRDEAKFRLREKIVTFGAVPRANIRPTDLGPVILPEKEGFSCREMRWGWAVSWDKSPLINAKSETLIKLKTFQQHLDHRCLLLADGFYEKGVLFRVSPVTSKPATLRCFIHIRFLDPGKGFSISSCLLTDHLGLDFNLEIMAFGSPL